MRHQALQLYDYHVWANEKVFNHLKELPRDTIHRELQSVNRVLLSTELSSE